MSIIFSPFLLRFSRDGRRERGVCLYGLWQNADRTTTLFLDANFDTILKEIRCNTNQFKSVCKYLDLFTFVSSLANRNEFFIIYYLQQANKMCSFLDLLDFSKMQQDKKVCVWKGEDCLI